MSHFVSCTPRIVAVGCLFAVAALGSASANAIDPEWAPGSRVLLAQTATAADENFRKAMELLRPSDNHTPTREEVDRAGHMLMEAGPDAFERAMMLLRRPNVTQGDITTAKQAMAKGGPDASDKAMTLLRRSYSY